MNDVADLVRRFESGDRRALTRVITLLEDGTEEGAAAYDAVFGRVGKAFRVGITGPPGAGKSSLVRELAQQVCDEGGSVGVVAVDPTSPLSGGALLGDRVRMPGFGPGARVFVRSMATRGYTGGLARTTGEVAELLDAFGHDVVFVETIGVGQAEVDVIRVCHSAVVVVVPESGDSVQAMKAGLLEVADVIVINKADRQGADIMQRNLREALQLRAPRGEWKVPVLTTSATKGEGVAELWAALREHRRHLQSAGVLERHRWNAARDQIAGLVDERRRSDFWEAGGRRKALEELTGRVLAGGISPRAAALRILDGDGNAS